MIYITAYIGIGLIGCGIAGWSGAFKDEKEPEPLLFATVLLWPVCIPRLFYVIGLLISGKEIK